MAIIIATLLAWAKNAKKRKTKFVGNIKKNNNKYCWRLFNLWLK